MTKPFVDHINFRNSEIDEPIEDDFNVLEELLKEEKFSFSLSILHDADGGMEFDYNGKVFAIWGAENSARGKFSFCLLNNDKGSEKISFRDDQLPAYMTTDCVESVIEIARAYFLYGELNFSYDWHVTTKGLWVDKEDIPDKEIIHKSSSNGIVEFLKTLN